MIDKDEQIQKFLELSDSSSFPHREELLRGITTGEYLLESKTNSRTPSEQLLDIYKHKANGLAKKKGNHAEQLRRDTLMFVTELENVPDDKVNIWSFSVNESTKYFIFEGVNSQKILGCILGVDKTKVSESDWEKLWNE